MYMKKSFFFLSLLLMGAGCASIEPAESIPETNSTQIEDPVSVDVDDAQTEPVVQDETATSQDSSEDQTDTSSVQVVDDNTNIVGSLFTTAQGAVDTRSLSSPARNSLYSCTATKMGTALDRSWVGEDGVIALADKPVVEGSIDWESSLNVAVDSAVRLITGNGLPDHKTGGFPVRPGSEASSYDRNPNRISSYSLSYEIPADPVIAEEPGCLPMGPIGVMLTGAVFYNALDADNRDAVANEVFDACEGHPQDRGQYHYHHLSSCMDYEDGIGHSPLIGYALDGFGIYGPFGDDGSVITNADLDECHGHVGMVEDENGSILEIYHYHANNEFPYTLGCLKGEK